MLRVHILTLFPDFFESPLKSSILGRSQTHGHINVRISNIRDFAENKHHRVDDEPFGGGGGMVMQVGPVVRAIEETQEKDPGVHIIHLSPNSLPSRLSAPTEIQCIPAQLDQAQGGLTKPLE